MVAASACQRPLGGCPAFDGLVEMPGVSRDGRLSTLAMVLYRRLPSEDTGSEVMPLGAARTRGGRMAERDKPGPADQDPAINAGLPAEIERLGDELAEAREQLAATSKVLAVIGRSASDLEAVLETVVESARKLCGADVGLVFLVDGDRYRFAYGSGMTAEYRELVANNP